MSTAPPRLNVAIIGAGIAGLAAAAVLRRQHSVVLYESDPAPAPERGTAIGIGPNGSKLLQDSFALSADQLQAVKCHGTRTHSTSGDVIREIKDMTASFDSDWLLLHRQDLKDQLFRLATASSGPGISGDPAKIVYGAEASTIYTAAGTVVFKNGQDIRADLVIGADGIHSAVRPFVTGTSLMAQPTGVSLYRFTIPIKDAVETLGYVPQPLDPKVGGFVNVFLASDASRKSVVAYPCRNFSVLNVACCVPDELLSTESVESWRAAGDVSEMLKQFEGFPSWILNIMKTLNEVKLYKVQDMDPLPCYVRNRTILIGDAAHPMTPFQGQGANQAIEDAEGLTLLLQKDIDRDSVLPFLQLWESVRKPRASQVQMNSRWAVGLSPQQQSERMDYNWTYNGIKFAVEHNKAK